jgi:excisionase family DNA binding protein
MVNTNPGNMSTGTAAKALDVSLQTVRNWVRSGKLSGTQTASGRVRVDAASVDAVLRARSAVPRPTTGTPASLETTLSEIQHVLGELQSQDLASTRLLKTVERERDRFRAEAAALRDASLQLVSAASETEAGVQKLLVVLDRQREALVQLLAPRSPEDLIR